MQQASCSWSGRSIEGEHLVNSANEVLCPNCGAAVKQIRRRGQQLRTYANHAPENPAPVPHLVDMRNASLATLTQEANAERFAWLAEHYLDIVDGMRVIEYIQKHHLRLAGLAGAVDHLRTHRNDH